MEKVLDQSHGSDCYLVVLLLLCLTLASPFIPWFRSVRYLPRSFGHQIFQQLSPIQDEVLPGVQMCIE